MGQGALCPTWAAIGSPSNLGPCTSSRLPPTSIDSSPHLMVAQGPRPTISFRRYLSIPCTSQPPLYHYSCRLSRIDDQHNLDGALQRSRLPTVDPRFSRALAAAILPQSKLFSEAPCAFAASDIAILPKWCPSSATQLHDLAVISPRQSFGHLVKPSSRQIRPSWKR